MNKVNNTDETAIYIDLNGDVPKAIEYKLELEGECKIGKLTFLRVNVPKTIVLTILSVFSVIGLLMIAWYKSFRVKLWYSEC